jgi:hypothetical protein
MAIAIIPQSANPKGSREEWLTMSEADDVICKAVGVKPTNQYYRNWFANFCVFDWCHCKSTPNNGYYVDFPTLDDAVKHSISIVGDTDTNSAVAPILEILYNKGYKVVSLNIG